MAENTEYKPEDEPTPEDQILATPQAGDGIQTEVFETLDDLKAQAVTHDMIAEEQMEEKEDEMLAKDTEPVVAEPREVPKAKGFWARLFGK